MNEEKHSAEPDLEILSVREQCMPKAGHRAHQGVENTAGTRNTKMRVLKGATAAASR